MKDNVDKYHLCDIKAKIISLTLTAVGKISLGGIFRSRLEFFFAIKKAAFSSERY